MRNYKLGAIFLLSGHCLSDPINMESINSMHLDAEPTFSVDGKEVYICLLYTSPSPRDVEESRMPSSA